jgi:hypothetical protein
MRFAARASSCTVTGFPFSTIYDALVKIYNELLSLNIPTDATSFLNNPLRYGDYFYGLFYIMLLLTNQGVIFVIAAGNEGGPTFLNVGFNEIFTLNAKIFFRDDKPESKSKTDNFINRTL